MMAYPGSPASITRSADGYLPHDLLRISGMPVIPASAPGWVGAALERVPWVVVRRALAIDAKVPIGIRGKTRDERFGAWLDVALIEAHLRPEQLRFPVVSPQRPDVPAIALARVIVPLFQRRGLTWGPTGSVGFEFASGMPTAHATSDLDLIIRWDRSLDRSAAAEILGELERLSAAYGQCRIDAHVETGTGAFSLAEYARTSGKVLMRTARGPTFVLDADLTGNSWHVAEIGQGPSRWP